MELDLSAVICTHNRYDLLEKAITSLLKQSHQNMEIIVVDNSPNRSIAEAFACRFGSYEHLRFHFEDVQNLSNARNAGARLSRGLIVAYMDDDAIADKSWCSSLVDAYRIMGPKTGCVGGRVLPIWSTARPPWMSPYLEGFLSNVDWGTEIKEIEPGEWLAGCNISFNRQLLLDKGGFRTDLGRSGNSCSLLSNEEDALIKIIKSDGKNIVYAPKAVMSHLVHSDRIDANWLRRRIVWQAISDVLAYPNEMRKNTRRDAMLGKHSFLSLFKIFRALIGKKRSLSQKEGQTLYQATLLLILNGRL